MKKILVVMLLVMVALAGCNTSEEVDTTGSLALNLTSLELQTLLPNIDMTIDNYEISGTGPNGATFTDGAITNTTYSKDPLAAGEWTITVKGINAAGTVIGQGQALVTIYENDTTSVDITVTPLSGTGTLDLTVNWNAADTTNPYIVSSLTPPSGTAMDLPFTITNGDTGTYVNNELQNGYYTLIVKLMDDGVLTMGAVEVARIVKDQTTTGVYDFTTINEKGPSLIVNITPEMNDAIEVTMSGQQAEMALGGSMTLSASVPSDVENVTYAWYINGEPQDTGDTFTATGLDIGIYRVDVTAFTTDGSRAGSATHTFNVVETITTDTEITFTDSNLEYVVRSIVNKYDGPIYASEVEGITELTASSNDIADINGLEFFTSLETLTLDGNQISDLTPLSQLTNLQKIVLHNNQISDITPMSQLTNLNYLQLGYNQISDISPLSQLTSLTDLTMNLNQIVDFSPIVSLTNLTNLNLSTNEITDITGMQELVNLRSLNLQSNNITNIKPIVDNFNIHSGDSVIIRNNLLDISSPDTEDMQDITALLNRDVTVYYDPQK